MTASNFRSPPDLLTKPHADGRDDRSGAKAANAEPAEFPPEPRKRIPPSPLRGVGPKILSEIARHGRAGDVRHVIRLVAKHLLPENERPEHRLGHPVILRFDHGGVAVAVDRVEIKQNELLQIVRNKSPLFTHAGAPSGSPAQRLLVATLAASRARSPGASTR